MPKKSRSASLSSSSSSRPAPTFASAQRNVVEFNPDYTNIKRDLKRIGILAVIFFALLIAGSFILPMVMH